jgi:hypothetical protein
MAISFKGAHFPPEVILMGVRWYLAYPLSTRHVEELMAERGVEVDHSTMNRWVIKYSSQLEEAFHRVVCLQATDNSSGRCFKSVDPVSDCSPKLVPIDEEPNHQIVHLFRLGETDRATDQSLDPRP